MNKASTRLQDRRADRLDELAALVRSKVAPDERALLEAFVRAYYGSGRSRRSRRAAARGPVRRCAVALATSPASASPAAPSVRVFNPTIEEHGWQSTHTVVEIVNDDMPFLVDSVTMEVNRHGLTLHLIMHPIVAVARDGRRHADGRRRERRRGHAPRIVHPRRGRSR